MLKLFKGDDTGGTFGRRLQFVLSIPEGISTDGCRAEFEFDGLVKTFDGPLVSGQNREIYYSHRETAAMSIGTRMGTFRLIDAQGRVRTIDNTIPVKVTDIVGEIYPGASSATVVIGGAITWDQIEGKPAVVKSVNGVTPDASGNVNVTAEMPACSIEDLPPEWTEHQMAMKIKEILTWMRSGGAALAIAVSTIFNAALNANADIVLDVQTAIKSNILSSASIVTNVTISGSGGSADGAARPLPKYLHALEFDDCYTNEAAWYYSLPHDYGSCSAVRDGGILYRNYDWKLDDAAEFVVRVSAADGRFASIGVANCGTNLTESFVTSGSPSRFYKCLPGRTVDGINANGVVAEVNVVDGDPHESGWPTNGTIHCMGAVRWVLDNAADAASAAFTLAAGVYFPSGFSQNFHWMIADKDETWIVENGDAHKVTGRAVMTNFRLYPTHSDGAGQERYTLLSGGSAITNAWFTKAYAPGTDWASDFRDATEMEAAKSAWTTYGKEALRGKGLWQTVHTSVYDIEKRTLRIAVQETNDWHVFALPVGGIDTDAVRDIVREEVPGYETTSNRAAAAVAATNDFLRAGEGPHNIAVEQAGKLYQTGNLTQAPLPYPFVRLNNYGNLVKVSRGRLQPGSLGPAPEIEAPYLLQGCLSWDIGHQLCFDSNTQDDGLYFRSPDSYGGIAFWMNEGKWLLRSNYYDWEWLVNEDGETMQDALDQKADSASVYTRDDVDDNFYTYGDGEALERQVAAIGAHLNAEDAHFVSTNYDSVTRIPEAYVEIKMNGNWLTIWREMTRWNKWTGPDFDWTGWNGFGSWKTNIESEVSHKAERNWGMYDSETGGLSPDGYTQISSSNILIAAGMAYQRTVTTDGAVWVLQCNTGTANIGGDTNGFFRIQDADGNTQFEIVKGDKREMGADAAGIEVDNSTSPPTLTIPYSVDAGDHPTIQVCTDLSTADWHAEDESACPATVTWSGSSGAWVARVTRKAPGNQLFVRATYMAGGETYIRNVAPVSMDSIMLGGVKYYLGTATIDGHTVLTLSTTQPAN